MIKLQKDSKTSYISLNEYMEWSVEIAGDASSLLDVYQYFMPSQQAIRQPESEPAVIESIDQTKPEDVGDPTVDPETNFVPMKNNEGEELLFPSFTDSHTSLMRQALTPELFDKLKSSETSNGIKLMQCIHMGVDVPKSDIGLVAADHESYETFSELFNAVLSSYHNINLTELLLPQSLYNSNRDSSELDRMDTLDYNFILSSRIQASRNVKGYSYSPGIAKPRRLALESSLMSALDKMKGEFSGTYWSLDSMPQDDAEFLQSNNLLLSAPSSGSAYDVAGVGRDWPNGRGVFSNKSTEFAVWVNGLDHISVISQNVGGDISSVFEDWITAMNGVERCLVAQGLEFDQDARLGYLTTCPGDVGSGFHASMVLKLENLTRQEEKLRSLCCQMSLNCEATAGSSHWKITNQSTLGKSEVEITQHVIDSVAKIIAEEKELIL
jgi:protein-arginine kinase